MTNEKTIGQRVVSGLAGLGLLVSGAVAEAQEAKKVIIVVKPNAEACSVEYAGYFDYTTNEARREPDFAVRLFRRPVVGEGPAELSLKTKLYVGIDQRVEEGVKKLAGTKNHLDYLETLADLTADKILQLDQSANASIGLAEGHMATLTHAINQSPKLVRYFGKCGSAPQGYPEEPSVFGDWDLCLGYEAIAASWMKGTGAPLDAIATSPLLRVLVNEYEGKCRKEITEAKPVDVLPLKVPKP